MQMEEPAIVAYSFGILRNGELCRAYRLCMHVVSYVDDLWLLESNNDHNDPCMTCNIICIKQSCIIIWWHVYQKTIYTFIPKEAMSIICVSMCINFMPAGHNAALHSFDPSVQSLLSDQDRDEGLLLDLSVFTDPPQPYQAGICCPIDDSSTAAEMGRWTRHPSGGFCRSRYGKDAQ